MKSVSGQVTTGQTVVTHLMVADGFPRAKLVSKHTKDHIILPNANADYGDTPRSIGSIHAFSQGFDAVCWLDADNWLEPSHVQQAVDLVTRDPMVEIVTIPRNLYRPDQTLLAVDTESDGLSFNDTNCYFVTRRAMNIACSWVFKDKRNAVVGDRFVWQAAQRFSIARCSAATVNYESKVAVHYIERGEQPPVDARVIVPDGNGFYKSVAYRA